MELHLDNEHPVQESQHANRNRNYLLKVALSIQQHRNGEVDSRGDKEANVFDTDNINTHCAEKDKGSGLQLRICVVGQTAPDKDGLTQTNDELAYAQDQKYAQHRGGEIFTDPLEMHGLREEYNG